MKQLESPRSVFVLAVIALLCWTSAGAQAAQSASKLTLIDEDPSSIFRLTRAWAQEPFEESEVNFFVSSDSLITQFGIELEWVSAELSFVSVVAGPGLPAGTTITPSASDGALGVLCTLPAGGAVLPNDDPVLILTMEPGCFGFGQASNIAFHEDQGSNNDNFFNAGGISYSPSTLDGGVNLQANWQYVMGEMVEALPMQSEVAWNLNYQNTVSARVTDIEVLYDEARLSVVDVLPGPDMPTALVTYSAAAGVLTVSIDGDMLVNGSYDIVTVVFALDTPDDDYITSLAFGSGCGGETLCGPTSVSTANPGGITVPDFVATATVQNVSVTRTASWFLLPVTIDANMPVHGYSLYMNYPPDPPGDITFLDIQTTGVAAPDFYYNEPQGRLYFQLDDQAAAYFGAGPQVVFKMKFGLAPNQSAGTQHQIQFDLTEPVRVSHQVADGTIHAALPPTTVGGTITLTNPPVTCPALSVWDGAAYRFENNILAACDGVKTDRDVVDHYLLSGPLVATKDAIQLRLTEDAATVTSFRDLALVAVDHPSDERIQIGSRGQILTLGKAIALRSARDHRGQDVTAQLLAPDEVAYRSDEPGWIELDFGALPRYKGESTTSLAGIGVPPPKEHDRIAKGGSSPNRLRILVRDSSGHWRLSGEFSPRERAVEQAAAFSAADLELGADLVLRLEWDLEYAIDVFELAPTRPFQGTDTSLQLLSVEHSIEGNVLDRLGKSTGSALVLAPGQAIDLRFDASGLTALAEGMTREFVFRAEGRYDGSGPELPSSFSFRLDEASPNPFNPITQILYALEKEEVVRLAIHDVRGQLVRKLVSEVQGPGEHSVIWNGRDDRNRAVASGVYFYVLEAGTHHASRKMVLMK